MTSVKRYDTPQRQSANANSPLPVVLEISCGQCLVPCGRRRSLQSHRSQDLRVSTKVALIANVIANLLRQSSWIDDGKVNGASQLSVFPAFANMNFPWAVAPFTTNGQ